MTELDRHDLDELRSRIDDLERAVEQFDRITARVVDLLADLTAEADR